jgi:hypothetical protein
MVVTAHLLSLGSFLSLIRDVKTAPRCVKNIPFPVYLAVPALGGYCLSSAVNFGAHWHHSASGMTSITLGTWRPHPNQEDLAVIVSVEKSGWATLMAGGNAAYSRWGKSVSCTS